MKKLKEELAGRDEELVRQKEELALKDELLHKTKDEPMSDVVDSYAVGFENAMTQVTCGDPELDLSQTGLDKVVMDGNLVNED